MRKYLIFLCILACTTHLFAQQKPFSDKTKTKKPGVSAELKSIPVTKYSPKPSASTQKSVFQGRLNDRIRVQKALESIDPDAVVRMNSNGTPIFVTGNLGHVHTPANGMQTLEGALQASITKLAPVLGLKTPEFKHARTEVDANGSSHVFFQQYYRGIPVWASDLVLHVKNNHTIYALNGRFQPEPRLLPTTPQITAAAAFEKAKALIPGYRELTAAEKEMLHYDAPAAELTVYTSMKAPQTTSLAWHLTIRSNFLDRWEYFVSATSGEVLFKYKNTCTEGPVTADAQDLKGNTVTVNTYEKGGNYYMIDATRSMFQAGRSEMPNKPVGGIMTIDAKDSPGDKMFHVTSSDNTWSDASAVSAHSNGAKCYEYYKDVHGRNSINGQGGTIISVVNMSDENGEGLDNAFWNGELMAYGNGNTAFTPLAGSLDVAGHEMTHGVVQNTANLVYAFQPGALNESMADIFGAMMDRDDWLIGEDVVKSAVFPTGALRSLSDPNQGVGADENGYQPKTMAQYQDLTEDQDHGGVHINSGIPNYAYYLFATAIGKDKAEKIYYKALSNYLTRSSQFIDCRLGVVQAATDLHGATSAEVTAAKKAFDDVGITDGNGTPEIQDTTPVQGQEYVILHGLEDEPEGLSVYNVATQTDVPLTSMKSISKTSVTDDGAWAFMVNKADKKVYKLNLKTPGSQPELVNIPGEWNNAAVSRDGSKLALVSDNADSSIYIHQLGNGQTDRFTLYNPTYTDSVNSGNPRYADVVEWDFNGEYVIYDAYTEKELGDGETISFWDVSVIRAWDVDADKIGDGEIMKLFTDLEDGANLGNPTFSKNSPEIMGFDYYNPEDSSYYVLSTDFEKNDIGQIFKQKRLGYPTYSRLDDKLAFTSGDADANVSFLGLKDNKIEAEGTSPTLLVDKRRWPVWFATGSRLVGTEKALQADFKFSVMPNPFQDKVTVTLAATKSATVQLQITDLFGRMLVSQSEKVSSSEGARQVTLDTIELPAGLYFLTVSDGQTRSTQKLIKQ